MCIFSPNADSTISSNYHIASDSPFVLTFDFVYHGNTLSKLHRDSPPLATASRWNSSKFVVIKHFGWESLNVQPSCCLDVEVYMLNCVFWRHIPLEIEFKSRVDMGSDSNWYTAQRYHPWADKTVKKILSKKLYYDFNSSFQYNKKLWEKISFHKHFKLPNMEDNPKAFKRLTT